MTYVSWRRPYTQRFQHGNFIAVRELHTLDAFRPDFLGKCGLVYDAESMFFEKVRPVGQGEDTSDSEILGFGQGSVDQERANPLSLTCFRYG
jgi:hypothetical protein